MKILKIVAKGLPLFKETVEIDFYAKKRVSAEKKKNLYHLFLNIYLNPAISFIGVNASGKTTTLRLISFVLDLLNNEPINQIESKRILAGLDSQDETSIEVYFYNETEGSVNKLETTIRDGSEDGSTENHFIITDEKLWSKDIKSVKTKNDLFGFATKHLFMERDNREVFLMDDVSIMVAYNKTRKTKISVRDTLMATNFNFMQVIGDFPKELLEYLDPSIESVAFALREDKKNFDIKLKFKGKEEIKLEDIMDLYDYLSSGTVKGLGVFINAFAMFSTGGYVIIDELENHFNLEIVNTLIRLFMDSKVNVNGATLIFSTHYAELLDEFERSDNVYLTRNEGGITIANFSDELKRDDIVKSEVYRSDLLGGTAPKYSSYIELKKYLSSSQKAV